MWSAWLLDPSQWATAVFTHSVIALLQDVGDVLQQGSDDTPNRSDTRGRSEREIYVQLA